MSDIGCSLAHGVRAGASLDIEGSIAEPMTGEGVDMKVQARGQSLADLGAAAGAELPALGPYDLSAQVAQDGKSYKLTGLTAKIGDSDLAGNVTLAFGGKRPAVSGSFTSANPIISRMCFAFVMSIVYSMPETSLLNICWDGSAGTSII